MGRDYFYFYFFVYIGEARVRANAQQGGQETRGAGEERTKRWGTETLDLWRERDGVGNMWYTRWTPHGLPGKKAGNF